MAAIASHRRSKNGSIPRDGLAPSAKVAGMLERSAM
jgi:hypothetical protein